MTYPPAPVEEDQRDAHCEQCGSLFHPTERHDILRNLAAMGDDEPEDDWAAVPGYDPAEADELIGRTPHAT